MINNREKSRYITVTNVQNMLGLMVETKEQMKAACIEYFKELLTETNTRGNELLKKMENENFPTLDSGEIKKHQRQSVLNNK